MDMNTIWAVIEPYIGQIVTWITASGLLAVLGKVILSSLTKKVNNLTVTKDISDAVVNSIASKDLKVSLESVNKKQLANVKTDIIGTFEKHFENIKNQNELLAAIAPIMMRFKAALPEEKEAIAEALSKLSGSQVKVNDEKPIVVTIEPIKTETTATSDPDSFDLF